jgi:CubicO group peptidase (beta-lactamase class C family)
VLIARATSMSLGAFQREQLFVQIGMNDTGFSALPDKLDRPAIGALTNPAMETLEFFDGVEDSRWVSPPLFESAGGGLVSTVDDLLAFGKLMLNNGKHGNERILARLTIELITTDQITAEQKAAAPFFPASWEPRGWGFEAAMVTHRDNLATPGRYGWRGPSGSGAT